MSDGKKEPPQITKDVLNAIDNDSWMYVVVWGPPRTGKSTFCMNLMYTAYKDWQKVLEATVFSLSDLLTKIKRGIPELWPTRNGLHMRIPILNWDDFAAHSGKAKTQHERSFDIFKGAFDTLGTKIGVLLVNMVSPRSPTQQLQEKYTHEVWVPRKGYYKYDEIKMCQDFHGWKAEMKKQWIQEGNFPEIPKEPFIQYDQLRMSLADEVLQVVEDSVVETHLDTVTKRIGQFDLDLLRLIQEKGMIYHKIIYEHPNSEGLKESVIRCRARGLITPVQLKGTYYKYDLTDLGFEVLKRKDEEQLKPRQYET